MPKTDSDSTPTADLGTALHKIVAKLKDIERTDPTGYKAALLELHTDLSEFNAAVKAVLQE